MRRDDVGAESHLGHLTFYGRSGACPSHYHAVTSKRQQQEDREPPTLQNVECSISSGYH